MKLIFYLCITVHNFDETMEHDLYLKVHMIHTHIIYLFQKLNAVIGYSLKYTDVLQSTT